MQVREMYAFSLLIGPGALDVGVQSSVLLTVSFG